MTLFSPSEFFCGYSTPWSLNTSHVGSRNSGTSRHATSPVELRVGDDDVYTHLNIGIDIRYVYTPWSAQSTEVF